MLSTMHFAREYKQPHSLGNNWQPDYIFSQLARNDETLIVETETFWNEFSCVQNEGEKRHLDAACHESAGTSAGVARAWCQN